MPIVVNEEASTMPELVEPDALNNDALQIPLGILGLN